MTAYGHHRRRPRPDFPPAFSHTIRVHVSHAKSNVWCSHFGEEMPDPPAPHTTHAPHPNTLATPRSITRPRPTPTSATFTSLPTCSTSTSVTGGMWRCDRMSGKPPVHSAGHARARRGARAPTNRRRSAARPAAAAYLIYLLIRYPFHKMPTRITRVTDYACRPT